MKKFLFLAFFGRFVISCDAQNFDWTVQYGDRWGRADEIGTDNTNAVYSIGTVFDTAFFESDTCPALRPGYVDARAYLVKHDPAGNIVWHRVMGGTAGGLGTSISVDPSGFFAASMRLDGDSINLGQDGTVYIGNSGGNSFLAKYDTFGNCIWYKRPQFYGNGGFGKVDLQPDGSIVALGGFWDSVRFDGILLSHTTDDVGNIFVVKYDNSGNILWADKATSTSASMYFPSGVTASSVSHDMDGNLYVVGNTYCDVWFDTSLVSFPIGSGYVAKYDASGNFLWVRNSPVHAEFKKIVCADNGYCIAAGGFDDPVIIGADTLSAAYHAGIIAKLDHEGNFLWGRQTLCAVPSYISDVALRDNKIYLCGSYRTTLALSSNPGITITNNVRIAAFAGTMDTSGVALWLASTANDSGDAGAYSITADAYGNAYFSGRMSGPIGFGDTVMGYDPPLEIFLSKIGSEALTALAPQINKDDLFMIYPNPSGGKYELNFLKCPDKMFIRIYDLNGAAIMTQYVSSPAYIDLSEFSNGIYFLEAGYGNKRKTRILVKD
ncbi:MAG: T9SS type A sorting domain-containing protein [Bacteroidia bacterium]